MYLRTCRYYSFKVKLWRMKVTAYSPISPSCLAPASPPFSSPPPNEAPPKLKTELAAAADDDDDDGISNPLTDGGAVAGLALAPLLKENPPAGLVPLPKEKSLARLVH